MKIKNKNLIILGIVFFVMLLLTVNVNAADYAYLEEDLTVSATIEDLGLGGTTSEYFGYDEVNEEYGDYVEEDGFVYTEFTIENVKQDVLNDFAKETRETTVDIALSLPSNTTKLVFEGEEVEIEEKDGKKYASFVNTIGYTKNAGQNVTPYKEDIREIVFQGGYLPEENYENEKLEIYFDNETTIIVSLCSRIIICSENAFEWAYTDVIDKDGISRCISGGMGYRNDITIY
ncbi:MAG: hypothetical protein IJE59_00355 [Clostridia bacterium]|nr:hypothetical protein [Clostridia bacterium]